MPRATGKRTRRAASSPSPAPKKQKLSDEPSSAWTVVKLKLWLQERDLPTTGKKAILLERAEEANDIKDLPKSKTVEVTRKSTRSRKKLVQESSEEESEQSENEESEQTSESQEKKERRTSKRSAAAKKEKEENGSWFLEDSVYWFNPPGSNDSEKIAAFDMDTTLVVPKGGTVHPKGRSDWRWMFPCVPAKLKSLHEEGYKVVIISNQKGISTGKTPAHTIQGKIEDLSADCGVPMAALLSTKDDGYRKPSPNMFNILREQMVTKDVDLSKSFYIGDAAGRPVGWAEGKKKDFGCSDRKFALNVGITFETPEAFFLGEEEVPFGWHGINPSEIEVAKKKRNAEDFISDSQEVIIFVGFPASGKSTFAKEILIPNGYVHINRDTLRTMAACKKALVAALEEGKSAVIDNTSPSVSARDVYLTIAEKYEVPVRCFKFETSEDLARHLNNFRENISDGVLPHVPGVGYAMFKKHFCAPTLDEGFTEIKNIDFIRSHPDEEHKRLFEQWTERK